MVGSMAADTATFSSEPINPQACAIRSDSDSLLTTGDRTRLLEGEILLASETHDLWNAAVTARIYLPLKREAAWGQITDYSRWVQYFPDITHSEVLLDRSDRGWKRLYQAASKNFLLFNAQVDIHLKVFENRLSDYKSQIQFRMERGSFDNFSADLYLEDYREGTLLTYQVKATPNIPVPALFIQQAIRMDLPINLEQMRRILKQSLAIA